jgi:hypothetical protein
MASVIRSVVRFANQNGIVKDAVLNAFVFANSGAADTAHLDAIRDRLIAFFTATAPGQGNQIGNYQGPQIDGGAGKTQILHYDISSHLDGTPAGSPIRVDAFQCGASSSATALPDEVCSALSYHGSLTGLPVVGAADSALPTVDSAVDVGAPATHAGRDRPRARHLGRIFLGPLSSAAADFSGRGHRPAAAFRTDVTKAALGLMGAFGPSGSPIDLAWSVWSRRNGGLSAVLGGWMDDRWDSQRRRRPAASVRTLFGA